MSVQRETMLSCRHPDSSLENTTPGLIRSRSRHEEYNGKGLGNGGVNAQNQTREAKLKHCWENQSFNDPEIFPRTTFLIPMERARMTFSPCFSPKTYLCLPCCNFAFWY